eukprot:TRINITY_DN7171_c0_g1_i1.p1 TRINITY_DN7171_c0_g1~~TRINITY_DN7171_c0_g1_i1.p1  ORF type:complete len:140 (-),score=45.32 TRINITY_DN7171_c0_g1_i1:73-492(-)
MFVSRVVSLALRTEAELPPMKITDKEVVKVLLQGKKVTVTPEKNTSFPLILRAKQELGELYHLVSPIYVKRAVNSDEFLAARGASTVTQKVWSCALSCGQTDSHPLAISIFPFILFLTHFLLSHSPAHTSENQNGAHVG